MPYGYVLHEVAWSGENIDRLTKLDVFCRCDGHGSMLGNGV